MKPIIFAIEGNIGSGKTTVLNALATDPPVQGTRVYPERIDEFAPYLEEAYRNPTHGGAAALTQIKIAMVHRDVQNTVLDEAPPVAIVERSPLSNHRVFGTVLDQIGHLTDLERRLLDDVHRHYRWHPDAYIYIDTPPDICYERMVARARPEEKPVDQAYLEHVHNAHTALFANERSIDGRTILHVDGTAHPAIVLETIRSFVDRFSSAKFAE